MRKGVSSDQTIFGRWLILLRLKRWTLHDCVNDVTKSVAVPLCLAHDSFDSSSIIMLHQPARAVRQKFVRETARNIAFATFQEILQGSNVRHFLPMKGG